MIRCPYATNRSAQPSHPTPERLGQRCGLWRQAQREVEVELPLAAWPVERPRKWLALVNRGLNDEQLETLRTCAQRGRPLVPEPWARETTARLGLELTLRGPGLPKTESENQ